MRRYFLRVLFFDLSFLSIIFPLMLWSTIFPYLFDSNEYLELYHRHRSDNNQMSFTTRVVALVEIDLFLFFWLFIRDKWKRFYLSLEEVTQEDLIDYHAT